HTAVLVFFFQAEDGIRDFHVTGVQTCALPISAVDSVEDGSGCAIAAPAISSVSGTKTARKRESGAQSAPEMDASIGCLRDHTTHCVVVDRLIGDVLSTCWFDRVWRAELPALVSDRFPLVRIGAVSLRQ